MLNLNKFLEQVESLGGKISNAAARKLLGVSDVEYGNIVDFLLDEGLIIKGRGRGGSIKIPVNRNKVIEEFE